MSEPTNAQALSEEILDQLRRLDRAQYTRHIDGVKAAYARVTITAAYRIDPDTTLAVVLQANGYSEEQIAAIRAMKRQ